MKTRTWLIGWMLIVLSVFGFICYEVYKVDPFFHYHKPDTDKYFYVLNNQRSMNNGIIRHFDYDAVIIGSSMIENFRTSEADQLFGRNFVKIPFSGASYREINDNICLALESNPNLKTIIRCLDMGRFTDPWDQMRFDLGEYPTYLYDHNPFNDVYYLLNRDIVFGRVFQMIRETEKSDFEPGITSFDDYASWQQGVTYGIDTVCPDGMISNEVNQSHLSDDERAVILQNIKINVTDTADKYPDVDFYYYYSPYSIASWNEWKENGKLYKMLEAEEYVTELIVSHDNIHLYSFNNRTDIITDLNNYKDESHYGWWVNSLILRWIHDGEGLITEYNYKDYLQKEYEFYTTFDYSCINRQDDYEADLYAAALLNEELTGAIPVDLLNSDIPVTIAESCYLVQDGVNTGVIIRKTEEGTSSDETISDLKFSVELNERHRYLAFCLQKYQDYGSLNVCVYDETGTLRNETHIVVTDIDMSLHQYVIDLSSMDSITVVFFNTTGMDEKEGTEDICLLSNICVY